MSATRIDISLKKYRIGITGAIPGRDHWAEPAMDYAIVEFISLFTGLVFKYGGEIVHGCHPAFTPIIVRQARLHSKPEGQKKALKLFMSDLWAKELPTDFRESIADVAEFITTKKIGEGGPEDPETRNKSLTEMRNELIASQNVMVAIGGKMHTRDGFAPGVFEEMEMAGKSGLPRFLVAGMGGAAAEFAKELLPSSLKNGLSDDQNALLFSSPDVGACINLIFEKLATQNVI